MAPRTTEFSTKHAASVNVNAKVGRMTLFPAWLAHSVDIDRAQEQRLSVSFNPMFEDYVGRLSKPRFIGRLKAAAPPSPAREEGQHQKITAAQKRTGRTEVRPAFFRYRLRD